MPKSNTAGGDAHTDFGPVSGLNPYAYSNSNPTGYTNPDTYSTCPYANAHRVAGHNPFANTDSDSHGYSHSNGDGDGDNCAHADTRP
jgi:hypothetical protein